MSRRRSIVGAQSSSGTITPGTSTASRFLVTANNTAAAPSFLVEPGGDSGFYWDAAAGVVLSVNSVERFRAPINSPTYLRTSGTGAAVRFVNTTGQVDFIPVSGSPEGASTAAVGTYAIDLTNGRLYLKRSGSGSTGWVEISPAECGTWTPTATAILNLDSITPSAECTYLRVRTGTADKVFWTMRFALDATATGGTQFRASLPIVSAFSASNQAIGTVGGATIGAGANIVEADPTNDQLLISVNTTSTSAQTFVAHGSYSVIP
jgi:hypothetical protein